MNKKFKRRCRIKSQLKKNKLLTQEMNKEETTEIEMIEEIEKIEETEMREETITMAREEDPDVRMKLSKKRKRLKV